MLMIYLSMLEDEQEKAVFTEIYNELQYPCLHVALKITKNQEMAEDAVHNAFLSIIKHKQKYLYLPRCKRKSLIVIIVKNKAIDLLRGEKKIDYTPIEDLYDDTIADDFDLSEYVTSNDSYRYLVECISKLPEKYRIVFQLRYMHNLSNIEIAERLGESQQIISMKIHRAKNNLRGILAKERRCNK